MVEPNKVNFCAHGSDELLERDLVHDRSVVLQKKDRRPIDVAECYARHGSLVLVYLEESYDDAIG